MDTLTHALSGALLARATAPQSASDQTLPLGRRLLVGFLAAAAPDLDFVIGYLGPIEYLYHHRGVTHSLILLPLWAFLLARLCAVIWRRERPWRAYFGVIAMGLAIHIVGDWITSFGTMILAPFSDARYGISTTFIIDPWFTGIILAGLAAAAAWQRSRAPALAGLAVLVGYVSFQYVLQPRAVDFGASYARAAGIERPQISALPRPVSPYNWMVVVGDGERYHYSLVSLSRREPATLAAGAGFIERLSAPYLPPGQAVWTQTARYGVAPAEVALAKEVWRQPQLAFFRWFAEYPALYKIEAGNPRTCVWFQDLRFFTPGRDTWPFRYGLCREGDAPWMPFELVGDARFAVY
jgi:inner membrane protein